MEKSISYWVKASSYVKKNDGEFSYFWRLVKMSHISCCGPGCSVADLFEGWSHPEAQDKEMMWENPGHWEEKEENASWLLYCYEIPLFMCALSHWSSFCVLFTEPYCISYEQSLCGFSDIFISVLRFKCVSSIAYNCNSNLIICIF